MKVDFSETNDIIKQTFFTYAALNKTMKEVSIVMSSFAQNLIRFRKESKMTQKTVAEKLNISFQTVSKWERGLCNPDAELLPAISDLFGTTTDLLLGHTPGELHRTQYCELYRGDEYYWGTEPTPFCYRILEKYPSNRYLHLLEIGCGEGRDAIFFARNGYDVTAYDIAEEGIRKVERLVTRYHVPVNAFCANMLDFHPKEYYDIVYASRALHYVPPQRRESFFNEYKEHTNPGGIHAFMVIVDKPSVGVSPDNEENTFSMHSGEIFTYYHDWDFLIFEEQIIDCNSSGIPHKHCVDLMLAVKPR